MKSILHKGLFIFSLITAMSHAYGQTSYLENFNTNVLPAKYKVTSGQYSLSAINQELKVQCTKTGNDFEGIDVILSAPIDLTDDWKKTFSFDIKTDTTTRMNDYKILVLAFSGSPFDEDLISWSITPPDMASVANTAITGQHELTTYFDGEFTLTGTLNDMSM